MIQLSPPPFSTDAIPKFEAEVAKATGTKYALATSSGTAAIHLALMVLGVGPGDVVLCPTFTFAATAFPILYCGATPVFYGCKLDMSADMDDVRLALRSHVPKAIIAVDLYGDCPGHEDLAALCKQHGIPLLVDAAESLGATYKGKKAGSFGTLSAISFNLNKIVTAGGGGALVSDDQGLVDRARFLATQAKDDVPWYQHSAVGYNYRIAAHAAAYGLTQIKKLKKLVAERRRINSWYRRYLPATVFIPTVGKSTNWLTTILCPNPAHRFIDRLAKNGIETRRLWLPMHHQPALSRFQYFVTGTPAYLFFFGLCLPSRGVTKRQVAKICRILLEKQ